VERFTLDRLAVPLKPTSRSFITIYGFTCAQFSHSQRASAQITVSCYKIPAFWPKNKDTKMGSSEK
jgi:hypothetical protein